MVDLVGGKKIFVAKMRDRDVDRARVGQAPLAAALRVYLQTRRELTVNTPPLFSHALTAAEIEAYT